MGKQKKTDADEIEAGLGEDIDWGDDDGDDIDDDKLAEMVPTVPRPLNHKAVHDRQIELATTTTELLNLEDRRCEANKKIHAKMKSLKKEIRRLAQEIQDRAERVPAQQELLPVAEDSAQRTGQRRGGGGMTGLARAGVEASVRDSVADSVKETDRA